MGTKISTTRQSKQYGDKRLEDVNDQLKIFDEIPYKEQAEELAETLNNIDSTKKSFNQLLSSLQRKKFKCFM